ISSNAAIYVTTALYIIVALVMIGIFLYTTEPSPLEETASLKSPIFIFLLDVSGNYIDMLIQGVTFAIGVAITEEHATSP
ncbi:CPBP family intramembrane glutamic endopeptidase, partial [Enterococcus faecalis]